MVTYANDTTTILDTINGKSISKCDNLFDNGNNDEDGSIWKNAEFNQDLDSACIDFQESRVVAYNKASEILEGKCTLILNHLQEGLNKVQPRCR